MGSICSRMMTPSPPHECHNDYGILLVNPQWKVKECEV